MSTKTPRTTLLAVSSILGATLWSTEAMRYPGAFTLNVFVGNWIAVPVILALLIALVRDLGSRIETGALFEDEIGLREPPPVAAEVEGEQPVAEPAGQGAG